MRQFLFIAASSLALAACGMDGAEDDTDTNTASAETGSAPDQGYETYSDDNYADSMASNDDASDTSGNSDAQIEDPEDRPVMQAQIVLDRIGFGPGVIDGKMGMSTENALTGFQEANDLEVTGKLDEKTKSALAEWDRIPATRVVTIPASWGDIEFKEIPEDTAKKAEMENLGYTSLDEKLAERFHTTVEVLRQLNPNGRPAGASDSSESNTNDAEADAPPTKRPVDGYFRAGQQIRVPNIGGDAIEPGAITDKGWQQTLAALGVGSDQPEVDRIVVSKSEDTLKAYQGDKLVAMFTVSSGSSQFPLPIGEWDILGEAYNPPYSYDPEVLGEGEGETYQLPPGPNGPVGVVWIDLSKEHYGIHGTPEPETIGRAQSSGCVRLTNWDAARLARMVSPSTQVIFEA
ncbi:L,D-transpeptidase family protein [Qipengyuania aquimaris]|nr:L,D-transpeptidase family protein [Qipengyuania aquimaris]